MKIRSGFVSNSSSSSFVVAFPCIPHNVEDIMKLLFEGETSPSASYTLQQFAETIFNDICSQSPMTEKELEKEFSSGYFIDMDDFEDNPENRKLLEDNLGSYFEKYNEIKADRVKTFLDAWLKEHRGAIFYCFEYGDESGEYYSTLEHGGMFSHLPYERISHH